MAEVAVGDRTDEVGDGYSAYEGRAAVGCEGCVEVEGGLGEVEALAVIRSEEQNAEWHLRNFETQMREPVEASLRVVKPLVF